MEKKQLFSELQKVQHEIETAKEMHIQESLYEKNKREQQDRKEKWRMESVKGYFKVLAGREMTQEEYIMYLEEFEKAETGYNIKNFVEGRK